MITEPSAKCLLALTDDVRDAKWGQRFQGPMPATEGFQVDVLNNDQLPGYPQPVSVHLFRTDRSLSGGAESADVHARIIYGNGGVTNEFACDWQGQFTVVASTIRIVMETYTTFIYDGYLASDRVVVFGALIGLGAAPSGGTDPISFTTGMDVISTGGSYVVPVPDFARRYYPFLVSDPSGGGTPVASADLALLYVAFRNAAGTTLNYRPLSEDLLLHGLPVPPGAVLVTVENTIPAGPTSDVGVAHHFKLGL